MADSVQADAMAAVSKVPSRGLSQEKFTHPGHRGHANQQTATKTLGPCGLLTGPTQREAALSLVAPCSGVGRGARLQACLLEHGDPFENGPRVVHHGSLGDLLRVVREVGLGANARGAVASRRSTAPLPLARPVRKPTCRREWGASPPVVSTIIGMTVARVRTRASLYCPSRCLTHPLPVEWSSGPWCLRPCSRQPRMRVRYSSSVLPKPKRCPTLATAPPPSLEPLPALCDALVGEAHLAS